MEQLPAFISILFGITTVLTVGIFYKASGNSKMILVVLFLWLILQGLISITGFYTKTNEVPPRFILLILPPLILIAFLFITPKGRVFTDSLDTGYLTLLHVIRIPVETVLFFLFLNKVIPEVMTFEGRNFDILSGITAPFVYYLGYVRKSMGRQLLILWNLMCIGLLINIVTIAILSAPFPFQQMAFEQPNIAVLYFPFVWLPCCVVPLVLYAHLATLRQLTRKAEWV